MKHTKRIVTVVVTVIMVLSTFVILAACNGSFNINWDNYIDELDSAVNKLPIISKKYFSSDVTVSTSYASEGLIVLSGNGKTYGYSIVANAEFGAADNLVYLYSGNYNTFRGYTQSGTYILYDITGKKVATGETINVSSTSSQVNGKKVQYLEIQENNTTFYVMILEDGSLSTNRLTALPGEETDTTPSLGETFNSTPITLGEWLNMTEEDEPDDFLESTFVRQYGRTVVFYNSKNKEISTFVKPLNFGSCVYIDKHLVYSTVTPVDSMAASGYNYISGSNKYNAKLFRFNIANGKTKELNVDYVLPSTSGSSYSSLTSSIYNKKYGKYDLAGVTVYRKVDGVAWAKEDYQDILIINEKGAIGFSYQDSPYGLPISKVGKNYVTTSGNIVNSSGKLVLDLSSLRGTPTVISNGIAIELDGKIGVIGFDGKVTVDFKYELIDSIYGNFAVVRDENGNLYSMNLATLTKHALYAESINVVRLNSYCSLIRTYNNGYYNWYDFEGSELISSGEYSSFSIYTYSAGEFTYGWASVSVSYGTEYLRFVFNT